MNEHEAAWRQTLLALIMKALNQPQEPTPVVSPLADLTVFLDREEAIKMGGDPLFGTLLLALDAFSDAKSHGFPDMGEGIAVSDGERVLRGLIHELEVGRVQLPKSFAPFERHLPYRP